MKKRTVGNVFATVTALIVGAVTIWASMAFLRAPDGFLDWVVLVLSGMTTGVIGFFVVWGHFQGEAVAG